jgi:hypothetical protein
MPASASRSLYFIDTYLELRLGEKRTRQAQNLVCLAQLAHFLLQRLDALLFSGGRPWTLASITLLLAYSATQRFRCAADLGCDGFDGRPLRAVLAGSLATMRTARSMTSFSQTMEPLQNPGRFTPRPMQADSAQACGTKAPRRRQMDTIAGDTMFTMILLLYFQQGLDVTLDQANLRGEYRTMADCERAARKLRGPIPIPRNTQAAWQDAMCIKINNNVRVNDMKPVELGKILQQDPPLGCQAEGAWGRVAEMCGAPERPPAVPSGHGGGLRK